MTKYRTFNICQYEVNPKSGESLNFSEQNIIDCVQYLTHEDEKQQQKGKHRYSDDEVKSNFDFRKEFMDEE